MSTDDETWWLEARVERVLEQAEELAFQDQAFELCYAIECLKVRATQIKGLRAAKGSDISPVARDLIRQIDDQLESLALLIERNRP